MSRIIRLDSFGVAALIFLGVSACGESRNRPGTGAAGAENGEGGSDVGGADSSGGGAGANGDVGAGGEDATTTPPLGSCLTHANCDDGLFCNGREQCRAPGNSDVKVCMAPEHGPCSSDSCDEAAKACDCSRADEDGDGFRVEGCLAPGEKPDCDDSDPNRHPALQEYCDLADPKHDEDCNDSTYAGTEADVDGDGFLNAKCGNYSRYQGIGASPEAYRLGGSGSDCEDRDPDSHPGAPEVCDGLDNNCDGTADELWGTPLEERKRYYKDADGDHWGDTDQPFETSCNIPPAGYSLLKGDCSDTDPQVAPGRAEVCNGYDDNCDEITDQPLKPGTLMLDEPYDGITEFECKGLPGWSVKTCPPGRLNCGDKSYLDACETIGTTLCNCHACDTACKFSCGEEGCAEIQAISGGLRHTCLLIQSGPGDSRGKVACMGRNSLGQLGLGNDNDTQVAALIPNLVGITGVASGSLHSCAVSSTGVAYCWGHNEFGQLGSGTIGGRADLPVLVYSHEKAEQVTAGEYHSCGIFEGGLAKCWGKGLSGQLGTSFVEPFDIPMGVVRRLDSGSGYEYLDGVSQIVAGSKHSCALSFGKVECWGSNETMQLGVDPTLLLSATTAIVVPGLEAISVDELSAAAVNTCARAGTEVYCWGANDSYQLAQEQSLMGPVTRIDLPNDVVGIAVGAFFACALRAGGEIRCWGSNLNGETGTVGEEAVSEPTIVQLNGAKRIFTGNGNQICALKTDGSAWCWGKNDFGQLGNGTFSSHPQPVPTRVSALGGPQLCPDVIN